MECVSYDHVFEHDIVTHCKAWSASAKAPSKAKVNKIVKATHVSHSRKRIKSKHKRSVPDPESDGEYQPSAGEEICDMGGPSIRRTRTHLASQMSLATITDQDSEKEEESDLTDYDYSDYEFAW